MKPWTASNFVLSLAVATLAAGVAAAHQHAGQPQGHGAPAAASESAAVREFREANAKMHRDMAIEFTDEADTDFTRGMIAHHQGAIEMANVVLRHGKDSEIRKLAEEVIAAQTKEIAFMRDWLARNP